MEKSSEGRKEATPNPWTTRAMPRFGEGGLVPSESCRRFPCSRLSNMRKSLLALAQLPFNGKSSEQMTTILVVIRGEWVRKTHNFDSIIKYSLPSIRCYPPL